MTIKSVAIVITPNKGEPKTFQLHETSPAVKNKAGKTSKSIWQPEENNKVVMSYGKVYINTEAK